MYVHIIDYCLFSHFLGEDHIPFLFRRLHRLTAKWEGFSVQLGVPVTQLENIKQNGTSADQCFALALWEWLKGCNNVSWRRLITAIFSPAGGENQVLAGEIAESFQGEITLHCSM